MTETTKYTPGPYRVAEDGDGGQDIVAENGRTVCLLFHGIAPEEFAANAQLLSAAPEMAEALLAFLRADLSDTKQGLALDERVRAALQKAGLL